MDIVATRALHEGARNIQLTRFTKMNITAILKLAQLVELFELVQVHTYTRTKLCEAIYLVAP